MTRVLDTLSRSILVLCVVLCGAIFIALSTQVISRYVFNAPIHMTDAVAEGALIWITFLGAAMVYRERGHIAVDLVEMKAPPMVRRIIAIAIHVMVIAVLLYMLGQVGKLQPLMERVQFGTLPRGPWTSKFVLVLLPFAIGAALTILFALEAIWLELTGRRQQRHDAQEII